MTGDRSHDGRVLTRVGYWAYYWNRFHIGTASKRKYHRCRGDRPQTVPERNKTIHDIAKAAKVGVGTVSRVLNNHPNVSDMMRQHVLNVIDEVGYRPHFAARTIRTRRSHLFGLLADSVTTTPFAYDMLKGAQDRAREAGRLLLVIDTDGNAGDRERAIDSFLERGVEGILYAALFHQEVDLPDGLEGVPTILVNCYARTRTLPSVVPNEEQGGFDATSYMLEHGHRRIAMITNDHLETGFPAVVGRLEGYKRALAAHGIPFDATLLREGVGTAASGYENGLDLLRQPEPPTAIFCGIDRIAMGALEAAKELGLSPPQDLSVVGFDNQAYVADSLKPLLTTMALPHYEMGHWAVNHLIHHLEGGELEPVQQQLVCPLIVRESVHASA